MAKNRQRQQQLAPQSSSSPGTDDVVSLSGGETDEERDMELDMQRVLEKDPEFYSYLEQHDKGLIEFGDGVDNEEDSEDVDDGGEMPDDEEMEELDVDELASVRKKENTVSKKVITAAMVDSWCNAVLENVKLGPIRSLLKVYRIACHYGDDGGDDSSSHFSIMSSSVFNKIMIFVLNKMDEILRGLMQLPSSGGKKETILALMRTKQWKNYNHLLKSYLGNSLHVLNQMTDTEMISFTLRRLKSSSVFLAAFPSLMRKYIKAALHFWSTGGGPLPIVSFLFVRDLCVRLGSDCIDDCFKIMYKGYVLNCKAVNAGKLHHIQLLANCIIELLGLDLATGYQHAFVYIRQMAVILRKALTAKTEEVFRNVYGWSFINCLELWTGAVCAYSKAPEFTPLAYPLTQIITGVARLVPNARYCPLRLRCAKMLNRIAAHTNTFIPVSLLLLDMLEMKELDKRPAKTVGEAIDMRTTLKVAKVNTRAFQEACVFSVAEELTEHLAQWSYSVAFLELSFIPLSRLRNFCKTTKVERFRNEMRQLVRQIEANCVFTNQKRISNSILPNDPTTASIFEDEKKLGLSPLSQYVATLRQRVQLKTDSLRESSVTVGEKSSVYGKKRSDGNDDDDDDEDEDDDTKNEQAKAAFSSSWLPGGEPREKVSQEKTKKKKKKKKRNNEQEDGPLDEDVVEDLILSSDEDGSDSETIAQLTEITEEPSPSKGKRKKGEASIELSRKNQNKSKFGPKKWNKKKKGGNKQGA